MPYKLAELFKKIDAFEPANLFFWQVPTQVTQRDGISLILYRNLRLIHHYKMSFQSRQFASTLHRLRVLLRRTVTLLESFPEFYEPRLQQDSVEMMQRYYEETKALRYLYFLGELAGTREDIGLSLYSLLKDRLDLEERAVVQLLDEDVFDETIKSLTSEIKKEKTPRDISLENGAREVVKEHLRKLEMLLAETAKGYDEEKLETLYLSMDTIQTLIEDFFHIIGKEKSQILTDELNILFKPLREYRNCKERAVTLPTIKEKAGHKTVDIIPLLCTHETELEEKIKDALRLLRSSRFYIS